MHNPPSITSDMSTSLMLSHLLHKLKNVNPSMLNTLLRIKSYLTQPLHSLRNVSVYVPCALWYLRSCARVICSFLDPDYSFPATNSLSAPLECYSDHMSSWSHHTPHYLSNTVESKIYIILGALNHTYRILSDTMIGSKSINILTPWYPEWR